MADLSKAQREEKLAEVRSAGRRRGAAIRRAEDLWRQLCGLFVELNADGVSYAELGRLAGGVDPEVVRKAVGRGGYAGPAANVRRRGK